MKRLLLFLFLITAARAQNTAKFPGAVPTTADLGVAANRAETTLASGINATATSIPVASSSGFKAGSFVTIDSEIIAVCSIPDGTHLNAGVSSCPNVDGRGVDTANGGGAAASHLASAKVQGRIVAWNQNQVAAEVIAIATKLHTNLPSITDYGLVGDGATDNTPLFNAMVASLCQAGKRPYVIAPQGYYLFNSRPDPMGCGMRFIGHGISSSPTDGSGGGVGTIFVRNYSEVDNTKGFLTWDGHLGTDTVGSGLDGVYLYAPAGKTGGIGVLLTGSDTGHRAGFFRMSNGFVSGAGGGNWFRSLVIDGSCCTTPGNSGIRDVTIEDSYLATSTDDFKTVYIYNGTNVSIVGGLIYASAGGSANVGLYVTGDASPQTLALTVAGLKVGGNITVDYAATGSILANVYSVTFTANASTYSFEGPVTTTPTNNCASCTMIAATQTGAHIVNPIGHPINVDRLTVNGGQSGGDDNALVTVTNNATSGIQLANPVTDATHTAHRWSKSSNNVDGLFTVNDGTTFWTLLLSQWSTKNLLINFAPGSGNTAIHANAAPDPLTVGGFIRADADPTLGITDYGFAYGSVLRHRIGSAAPVSGTYKRGDVIWNTAPSAGGTIGWVCVSAGTPGTWKTFGAITP